MRCGIKDNQAACDRRGSRADMGDHD